MILGWKGRCTCGAVIDFTPQNTTIYHYHLQTMFDFLKVHCAGCNSGCLVWGIDQGDVQKGAAGGIPLQEFKYASDEVRNRYNAHYKITLLEPRELMPRQERLIAFFAYEIDHGVFDLLLEGGE